LLFMRLSFSVAGFRRGKISFHTVARFSARFKPEKKGGKSSR